MLLWSDTCFIFQYGCYFWRTRFWLRIIVRLNWNINTQRKRRKWAGAKFISCQYFSSCKLLCCIPQHLVFIYGITIWMIAYWGFENKQMELREWNIWILNPPWTNIELKEAFSAEAQSNNSKEWRFIMWYNKYFYFSMWWIFSEKTVMDIQSWLVVTWVLVHFYIS